MKHGTVVGNDYVGDAVSCKHCNCTQHVDSSRRCSCVGHPDIKPFQTSIHDHYKHFSKKESSIIDMQSRPWPLRPLPWVQRSRSRRLPLCLASATPLHPVLNGPCLATKRNSGQGPSSVRLLGVLHAPVPTLLLSFVVELHSPSPHNPPNLHAEFVLESLAWKQVNLV